MLTTPSLFTSRDETTRLVVRMVTVHVVGQSFRRVGWIAHCWQDEIFTKKGDAAVKTHGRAHVGGHAVHKQVWRTGVEQ